MTTVQIKRPGATTYSTVPKKDFFAALEDSDGANDTIMINGSQYALSTVIVDDPDGTGAVECAITSTVADTYIASGNYTLASGLCAKVKVNVSNTGPATININGTGVIAIQLNGAALAAKDIHAGEIYLLTYDGTAFQLRQTSGTARKKVYKALLTQVGTAAPTAIVAENQIGAIVWSRAGVGSYAGTLAGAFTANKTYLHVDDPAIVGDTAVIGRTSADAIFINTSDEDNVSGIATPADSLLTNTQLLIEVYY